MEDQKMGVVEMDYQKNGEEGCTAEGRAKLYIPPQGVFGTRLKPTSKGKSRLGQGLTMLH